MGQRGINSIQNVHLLLPKLHGRLHSNPWNCMDLVGLPLLLLFALWESCPWWRNSRCSFIYIFISFFGWSLAWWVGAHYSLLSEIALWGNIWHMNVIYLPGMILSPKLIPKFLGLWNIAIKRKIPENKGKLASILHVYTGKTLCRSGRGKVPEIRFHSVALSHSYTIQF